MQHSGTLPVAFDSLVYQRIHLAALLLRINE